MPGTPLGLVVPAACSPAQSFGLVWPVATVPAVVRSSRQTTCCSSAPGTAIFDWRAQWAPFGLSAAAGTAVASAPPRARTSVAVRAAVRRDLVVSGMRAMQLARRPALNVGAAHKRGMPRVPVRVRGWSGQPSLVLYLGAR